MVPAAATCSIDSAVSANSAGSVAARRPLGLRRLRINRDGQCQLDGRRQLAAFVPARRDRANLRGAAILGLRRDGRDQLVPAPEMVIQRARPRPQNGSRPRRAMTPCCSSARDGHCSAPAPRM